MVKNRGHNIIYYLLPLNNNIFEYIYSMTEDKSLSRTGDILYNVYISYFLIVPNVFLFIYLSYRFFRSRRTSASVR